jgi:hypothetical protein
MMGAENGKNGEMRHLYTILVEKTESRGATGIPKFRWDDI